jgi:hypothetical protein
MLVAGELFKMMTGVNMIHVPIVVRHLLLQICSADRCRSTVSENASHAEMVMARFSDPSLVVIRDRLDDRSEAL